LSSRLSGTIRSIALLESGKGIIVLLVGFGLMSFVHGDIHLFGEQIVKHLHLNPAKGYPRIFLDYAPQLSDVRLGLLAVSAFAYSLVRFIEAYGCGMGNAGQSGLQQ